MPEPSGMPTLQLTDEQRKLICKALESYRMTNEVVQAHDPSFAITALQCRELRDLLKMADEVTV